MGLDSVEILVRVEEYFGISIPNGEAQKILTVQEFADCVFAKVTINPTEKCKSQMLFYKLRRYFIDKIGPGKEQVRIDSKIANARIERLSIATSRSDKSLAN